MVGAKRVVETDVIACWSVAQLIPFRVKMHQGVVAQSQAWLGPGSIEVVESKSVAFAGTVRES